MPARILYPILFTLAIYVVFQHAAFADFKAVYFAGLQYANGEFDQVYPPIAPLFDLSYPESWDQLNSNTGIEPKDRLYPFISPPLWAAVASWVLPHIPLWLIFQAVLLINAGLVVGMGLLGWRIARSDLNPNFWLSLVCALCVGTAFGYVALRQGQPQIFISFLVLLAIERSRAKAPIMAGASLALAASIKLYPLLFILIWIARKDWRATFSFAAVGAALGALSILIAGWPLHELFLAQINIISNTALVTALSYNLTAAMTAIVTLNLPDMGPQFAVNLLPNVGLSVKLSLITAAFITFVWSMRVDEDDIYRKVWPIWMILVSFLSPMSWGYHYLPAIALFPIILETQNRYRVRWGLTLTFYFLPLGEKIAFAAQEMTHGDHRSNLTRTGRNAQLEQP